MGIGHVALGLGLKRADPRINAGLLIFAAFFADFLLGWFALAGWETYEVPPGYASKHYLLFTFPWSHGLLPDLIWAAALGLAAFAILKSRRAGFVVAAAVISHYLLDGIVHVKGLPVAGPGSPELGLGLWRNLPLELGLEVAMAAAGLAIYFGVVKKRRIGMAIYTVILTIFTVVGQATATEAPPGGTLIASWVGVPLLCGAIAWRLDRP